jgi:hypothetical protein
MGSLPQTFAGDRSQADTFISELKDYVQVNTRVPGFESPYRKVALALTLIKRPEVNGWATNVGA